MIDNQTVINRGCRVVPLIATFPNFKTNEKKFPEINLFSVDLFYYI